MDGSSRESLHRFHRFYVIAITHRRTFNKDHQTIGTIFLLRIAGHVPNLFALGESSARSRDGADETDAPSAVESLTGACAAARPSFCVRRQQFIAFPGPWD